MATGTSRTHKIFLGRKLRRFREQQDLTQASMASSLGISASYLNQIENDQRPLSAQVLLKLSTTYRVDLHTFSYEENDRLASEILSCLDDPVFQGGSLDMRDLKDAISSSTELAKHFLTLYRNYSEINRSATAAQQFPYEEVRDFFFYKNNYFDNLDKAAEQIAKIIKIPSNDTEIQLIQHLKHTHNVTVATHGEETKLRSYDALEKRLTLSKLLSPRQRVFQLAHQTCLLGQPELLDSVITNGKFSNKEAKAICRLGLANYFAGALLMPYTQFLEQARLGKYDIERLQLHFDTGYEQVCHRLNTLQRPNNMGIPFYFVRVDMAGNISKRQSASGFHFSRAGGTCPLWNAHKAFSTPGKILRQIAELPDGKRFFCLARTVDHTKASYLTPQKTFSIGIGCDISYASDLVYSTGLNLNDDATTVPIGVGCRVCERDNCQQRAFPPSGKAISINEDERSLLPYGFIKPS